MDYFIHYLVIIFINIILSTIILSLGKDSKRLVFWLILQFFFLTLLFNAPIIGFLFIIFNIEMIFVLTFFCSGNKFILTDQIEEYSDKERDSLFIKISKLIMIFTLTGFITFESRLQGVNFIYNKIGSIDIKFNEINFFLLFMTAILILLVSVGCVTILNSYTINGFSRDKFLNE